MINFLKNLQLADINRRKRWMVGATAVTMGVVIYFWLSYFNGLVADLGKPILSEEQDLGAGFSLGETAKGGVAAIREFFAGIIGNLGGILQTPREYLVKPPM